jgi:hypothetical protein
MIIFVIWFETAIKFLHLTAGQYDASEEPCEVINLQIATAVEQVGC